MYFSKVLAKDIIEYAVSKGADKDYLLSCVAIDFDSDIDQAETVTYHEMVSVLNIASQSINDECLGLHMGEQLMFNATKQVDQIMHHSPTIDEAFSNAISYSKLISDALKGRIDKTDSHTKVIFEVNPNWAVLEDQAVQQIIDMTLVCTAKSIYWLTGMKCAPVEVHLPHLSLKKRNEYYRVFDCSLKFKEQDARIIFSNPILNLPIPTNNLGLLACLKTAGDDVIEKLESEDSLIFDIKKTILYRLPHKQKLESVAQELSISSRTLQRKLKQLDTSYKKIEKEILIKLAKKLILEDRSIDEASYLLGFSEASAFVRFFKAEIKTTPGEYKKIEIGESS